MCGSIVPNSDLDPLDFGTLIVQSCFSSTLEAGVVIVTILIVLAPVVAVLVVVGLVIAVLVAASSASVNHSGSH